MCQHLFLALRCYPATPSTELSSARFSALNPTEGRKNFRCLRHGFRRATAKMVAKRWRCCLVGIHAVTLFWGRSWGRMLLTVSALIKQHIRSFCLPNKEKTVWNHPPSSAASETPKAGNHTFSTKLRLASGQILTTIWSSEATDTLLSSK